MQKIENRDRIAKKHFVRIAQLQYFPEAGTVQVYNPTFEVVLYFEIGFWILSIYNRTDLVM